jgi:hypothetical protein
VIKWLWVVIGIVGLGGVFLAGHALWPRQVRVVVEREVVRVERVNDSVPYPVYVDTGRTIRPEPRPVPETAFWVPQRQVIYGFTRYGGLLTLSVFDSLSPHYRQVEQSTADSLRVSYNAPAGAWDIESWPTRQAEPERPKAQARRAWRLTASGTLGWSPGSGVWTELRPGVLFLGHAAVGPYARLSLDDLRGGRLERLQAGGFVTLVW